jgi:hypothetical protein
MSTGTSALSLKIDDPTAAALDLDTWGAIGSAMDGPMETRGHELWRSPQRKGRHRHLGV